MSDYIESHSLDEIDELLRNRRVQIIIKRIFDVFLSLFGLLITFHLFLIITIVIKLDTEGPVLFKQDRVGKGGKIFRILKFRTMIVDTGQEGMMITVGKDSRITKSGHILRNSKLDELPQLINVLIGDMSFVGPRPEVLKYISLYNNKQKNILKVKPGITDLASIEYRDESALLAQSENPEKTYVEEIMPRKIELNLMYIKSLSVIYDIRLIFKTLYVIIKQ